MTAFSGEITKQRESAIKFTEESRIVSVGIHAVGMENTTAGYSGQDETA
jgi:hypothetical protein